MNGWVRGTTTSIYLPTRDIYLHNTTLHYTTTCQELNSTDAILPRYLLRNLFSYSIRPLTIVIPVCLAVSSSVPS